MVFGLFSLLGYNFSPRFRDLADQRFWRAEVPGVATGGYGPLEPLARNKVNLNKVITHWPDMLRVAGSLVTGQVRAYDLLRMFGREGRPPRSVPRSPSTSPGSPAQAREPQRAGPLQLPRLHPGWRRPAAPARPGHRRH
jgi:Tn3 transposase DDE domain